MPQILHLVTRLRRGWPLWFLLLFFIAYFWRIFFTGMHYVTGDAVVYAMPLRATAWQMLRQGEWPLWTPTLLSGYPLLSMATLGLGYPLTWFYGLLPDYLAEEIYVLAPFLLSPMLMFAYLRQVGRSRWAALLGGLSFGYGGFMAGGLSHNGMLMNAVMWLPLFLLALERGCTGQQWRALLLAVSAYALSLLTGMGQGFVAVAIIAGAYALCLGYQTPTARWRVWGIAAAAVTLASGLGAWQIAETMQMQQRSIRRQLSYEMFSGGALNALAIWRSFWAPLYHYNHEVTTYVTPLVVLLALVAVAANAARQPRDWRVWFWLSVAVSGWLLMQGDGTPLYRWLYRVPVVNLFRVPWRHAYEWTLGIAMLAAWGWDAAADFVRKARRAVISPNMERRLLAFAGLAWLVVSLCATRLVLRKPQSFNGYVTALAESHWAGWKLLWTVLLSATLLLAWRLPDGAWRKAWLAVLVFAACYWEPAIFFHHLSASQLHPANYYTQTSEATRFLRQHTTEPHRIYTSTDVSTLVDVPTQEAHNLSARRGLHNAAGYEPLMWRRYADVFGSGLQFMTPNAVAPNDEHTFQSEWQALDVLNVRYHVLFSSHGNALPTTIEKHGARFAAADHFISVSPGQAATFEGMESAADTLTLVSALANSADLAQGAAVARLIFELADQTTIEHELKAGHDTAEWAAERADVQANRQHTLAPIYDSRPGDLANTFRAHRYWTKVTLPQAQSVRRITLTNLSERATLLLSQALLYDARGGVAHVLVKSLPAHWQRVWTGDGVTIHENPRAFPRAWLTAQAESVAPARALQCLREAHTPGCDLRRVALLEAPARVLPANLTAGAAAQPLGEVRWILHAPNQLSLTTQTSEPRVLVLSEMNLPGWRATIDGVRTPIYTTDYLLRGLIVPAGEHRIVLRYESLALRRGLAITLATLLLCALVALKAWRA